MIVSQAFESAKNSIKTADHLLTVNYALSDDPKLFVNIVLNLKKAIEQVINIFLIKENKDINLEFDKKIDFFKEITAVKYNIPISYINMISEIRTISFEHDNSTVEFARKEEYIICDEDYKNLKSLDKKKARELVTKAKLFIVDISNYLGD